MNRLTLLHSVCVGEARPEILIETALDVPHLLVTHAVLPLEACIEGFIALEDAFKLLLEPLTIGLADQ